MVSLRYAIGVAPSSPPPQFGPRRFVAVTWDLACHLEASPRVLKVCWAMLCPSWEFWGPSWDLELLKAILAETGVNEVNEVKA